PPDSPADPPALPSFPTRRSSDLAPRRGARDCSHPARRGARGPDEGARPGDDRVDGGQCPALHEGSAADRGRRPQPARGRTWTVRSEEHTSELQSPYDLVCRLLLE